MAAWSAATVQVATLIKSRLRSMVQLPAGISGSHMLAATPPMGWNSWNTFGPAIDEELILDTADAMVDTGLRDAGYRYLVVDDAWMASMGVWCPIRSGSLGGSPPGLTRSMTGGCCSASTRAPEPTPVKGFQQSKEALIWRDQASSN